MSRMPAGSSGSEAALPSLLKQHWRTINPAHAIQRAAAVVTFPENIPSFVVNRTVEAARSVAAVYGLSKEDPVSTTLLQIGPGGAQQAAPMVQEGIAFQRMEGAQVLQSFSVTKQSIRFETMAYTRWAAFRDQVANLFGAALPVLAQSTPVRSIELEYIDFFYAAGAGAENVGLIIDNQSKLIAQRAFRRHDPFHAHSGWFEERPAGGQNLINVDVNVADANGPVGLRRTITIRTYEAEQVADLASRGLELTAIDAVLKGMDELHISLKGRLGHILTNGAKNMISFGN